MDKIFKNKITFTIASTLIYFNMLYSVIATYFFVIFLKEKQKQITILNIKNIPLFAIILYYLTTLTSLFWSKNTNAGLFDLQVKLSLLIIPVFYLFFNVDKQTFISFAKSFVYGTIIINTVHLFHLIYLFITLKQYVLYYYSESNFVLFLHPTYYSILLDIALILGVFLYKKNHLSLKTLIISIIIIYINLFFAMSKAGLIVSGLLLLFVLYIIIPKYKIILVLVFSLGSLLFLKNNFRFKEMIYSINHYKETLKNPENKISSTSSRILTWNSAYNIWKNNIYIGVGTGDTKDKLMSYYKQHRYTHPYQKKLNAHNQYLESLVSVGILGTSFLVLSLILSLVNAYLYKNWILGIITIIFALNFLAESMLNTQMGVLSFAFFMTIFNKYLPDK